MENEGLHCGRVVSKHRADLLVFDTGLSVFWLACVFCTQVSDYCIDLFAKLSSHLAWFGVGFKYSEIAPPRLGVLANGKAKASSLIGEFGKHLQELQ